MDTDVLIVGAGPTGLMLANQLARRSVRARIIDRHAGPTRETRALGVQARTLEIYQHLGIVEQALELGKRALTANLWALGRLAARVRLGDIGRGLSPYPYLLILGQDDNERLLGDVLRRFGLAVEWNTELVGLSQESDRVKVTLKQPDGANREIAARWVAGCDGAHSAVRQMNGIAFVGAPYQHVFFVADTRMTGSMVPDELNIYLLREAFHLFFPMRGTDHWRIVGIVPAELRGKEDLTFDDVLPSVRRQAGPELNIVDCSWFSTYRIHHRRAERLRDHRCFLLGDAAHIHSPVGAQGMNTGLQDAYNLGWKLGLVISGSADAALLDTYQEERLPVAERLLSTTDRLFSFIVSDSRLVAALRARVLPRAIAFAMSFERVRRLAFRTISQIGIRYRPSRLSETERGLPVGAPRAGDRFPWIQARFSENGPVEDVFTKLDDTRFNLIVVGQPALPGALPRLGEQLRTLSIPSGAGNDRELDRARIPRPSFYLLRPDCHIGLCGTRLEPDAISLYFARLCGAPSATG